MQSRSLHWEAVDSRWRNPHFLGFLPGSNYPHYDGETTRRAAYHRLVSDGMPEGIVDDEDASRFLVGSRHVIAIEQAWFQKCLKSKMFLYEFNPSSFQVTDIAAGYYTSRESMKPIAEYELSEIFNSLLRRGIEVRVLPTLWYLRDQIAASSLGFSIIRMRNAGPMPISFPSRFEVPR